MATQKKPAHFHLTHSSSVHLDKIFGPLHRFLFYSTSGAPPGDCSPAAPFSTQTYVGLPFPTGPRPGQFDRQVVSGVMH